MHQPPERVENDPTGLECSALELGPRKKPYVYFSLQQFRYLTSAESCIADPLVHHGRHFGRTIHALCNVQALLTKGVLYTAVLAGHPEGNLTTE